MFRQLLRPNLISFQFPLFPHCPYPRPLQFYCFYFQNISYIQLHNICATIDKSPSPGFETLEAAPVCSPSTFPFVLLSFFLHNSQSDLFLIVNKISKCCCSSHSKEFPQPSSHVTPHHPYRDLGIWCPIFGFVTYHTPYSNLSSILAIHWMGQDYSSSGLQ